MKRHLLTIIMSATSVCIHAQSTAQSTDSLTTQDARLDSLYRTLDELVIVGERPMVKMQPGKLVFDLPKMIKDRPVDNVYDAVKELPGVTEMNESLQLAGQSVNIILDGKVTTLSAEQTYALLKSIPASRIESAEVMYNAPARYQVRGTLINITLKRASADRVVQGESFSKYFSKGQNDFTQRGSLLYQHGKLSMDFLYTYNHYSNYHATSAKEAIHTLSNGSVYEIRDTTHIYSHGNTHAYRLGADYDFAEKHQLSFVYTGRYYTAGNNHRTNGTTYGNTASQSDSWLHNLRVDYRTPIGLTAGAEMTYYNAPLAQTVRSVVNDETLDFYTESGQRINRWKFYLSGEHPLGKGWGLNYGTIFTPSIDNSYQLYFDADTHEAITSGNLSDMRSRRREETLNIYAGVTKQFGEKLSFDFSLATERYKSPAWDEWDYYPTLSLIYMPSQGNTLQLNFSSLKSYPEYWAMQDAVSYQNAYSEIHGNPLLKPFRSYGLSLSYILKNKYMVSIWVDHHEDYYTQTLYQSPDRFVEIYKYLNFDYRRQAGMQIHVPFKIRNWLDSRLNLSGTYNREKDSDFWDIPFNRHVFTYMINSRNTFTLPTKADMKFTLDGYVQSKLIQGTYNLPASGAVNASFRYAFASQNAILQFYCNDIFETAGINPRIRFKGQYVTNTYSCFRELGVSFTYKFGGYKEKRRSTVDTSRFK